jgi:hypothetical protein
MVGARSLLRAHSCTAALPAVRALAVRRGWEYHASKIEPGHGGGRLMGLDGHQPPRSPAVRCCESPVAFPRGGAFLLGARPELCGGKWSVQKEATPRFQPCSDDTLPLSYVPHLPPSPVRARGSCTAPSRSAVSPHLQCGDSRTPAIPRRDAQNFRGRWQKNACELAYRASARCATTRYTDALPIFSFRAISVGPKPEALSFDLGNVDARLTALVDTRQPGVILRLIQRWPRRDADHRSAV